MQTLYLPLGLFAAAAVIGLYMATRIFGGNMPPWAAGIVHAGLGAAGLLALGLVYLNIGLPLFATVALIVLVVAALGGGRGVAPFIYFRF